MITSGDPDEDPLQIEYVITKSQNALLELEMSSALIQVQ